MKPIPESDLRAAELEASPPVKQVHKYTAAIFSIVADMKAAKKIGMPLKHGWQRLRDVLDAAMEEDDATALDDLKKALANLEVGSARITVTSGKHKWEWAEGHAKNKPIAPVTMAFIQAIRNIQGRSNRAPTRQEILDEINLILVDGVDETEVSRQISRLAWNDII
jgi:hypothetical protein